MHEELGYRRKNKKAIYQEKKLSYLPEECGDSYGVYSF